MTVFFLTLLTLTFASTFLFATFARSYGDEYPEVYDLRWSNRTAKWSVDGYADKYEIRLYRDDRRVFTKTVSSKSTLAALEGLLLEAGTDLHITGYDLKTGICLKSTGEMNAQRTFGADVISRITACGEGKLLALRELRTEAERLDEIRLAANVVGMRHRVGYRTRFACREPTVDLRRNRRDVRDGNALRRASPGRRKPGELLAVNERDKPALGIEIVDARLDRFCMRESNPLECG